MSSGLSTIIYPVRDLARAKELYTALLGEPTQDAPYYVGFEVGDQQLGLDPHGHEQGLTGPVGFWTVDDIQGQLSRLLSAGAQEVQPVRDVGGGKLIASVKDADGNMIGLMQNP
jgi:predicted enzyme related to lactoylglutathione lyase